MVRRYDAYLSTGDAAKRVKVSQQTIIRAFDEGRLKGQRIPGSKFRRISTDSLYRMMRREQYPVELRAAVDSRFRVLILGETSTDEQQELLERLSRLEGTRLLFGGSLSDPREIPSRLFWRPDAVILFSTNAPVTNKLTRAIRRTSVMRGGPVILFARTPIQVKQSEAMASGVTEILNSQTTIEQLSERVRELARAWRESPPVKKSRKKKTAKK